MPDYPKTSKSDGSCFQWLRRKTEHDYPFVCTTPMSVGIQRGTSFGPLVSCGVKIAGEKRRAFGYTDLSHMRALYNWCLEHDVDVRMHDIAEALDVDTPWLDHGGSGLPLNPQVYYCQVKWRHGGCSGALIADNLFWDHSHGQYDIVAVREIGYRQQIESTKWAMAREVAAAGART